MAILVLTLANACSSGGHVNISATVNGVSKGVHPFEADELLNDITDDEIAAAIKIVLRLYKIGKTRAQVRTAITSGLTVTV